METLAARILLCVTAFVLANACASQPDDAAPVLPASNRPEPQAAERQQECLPVAPKQLPDGSAAGDMRVVDRQGKHLMVTWGAGSALVAQKVGVDDLDIIGLEEARIRRPGPDVFLMLVGDPGVGQTALAFEVGVCTYTVWLTPEVPMSRARTFARRYPTLAVDLNRS